MAGPARTTRRRRSNQDRHATPNSIESPTASTSFRGRPHSHPSSARTKAPSSSPFPSRSPCHRDHTRTEKRPGRTPTTSRPPRGLDPTPLPTCGRGETSWATCTLAKARTKAWYSVERQRRFGRTCLPNRLGWTEKSEFVRSYFSHIAFVCCTTPLYPAGTSVPREKREGKFEEIRRSERPRRRKAAGDPVLASPDIYITDTGYEVAVGAVRRAPARRPLPRVE